MNSIDTSGKIKFTMSVPEFLDLSLLINGQNKICIYVYAKPTNRPTCVLPSIRYSKRNISNIPKSITLTLTLSAPIPQNDQTHSNNSSAICRRIIWVCLTILWIWCLKSSEGYAIQMKIWYANYSKLPDLKRLRFSSQETVCFCY